MPPVVVVMSGTGAAPPEDAMLSLLSDETPPLEADSLAPLWLLPEDSLSPEPPDALLSDETASLWLPLASLLEMLVLEAVLTDTLLLEVLLSPSPLQAAIKSAVASMHTTLIMFFMYNPFFVLFSAAVSGAWCV